MLEIGVAEAAKDLDALLDRVEQGEEVLISRRGKRIARLALARGEPDREAARRAAAAIIEMSKEATLGGLKIKDLVNEGRR